MTPFITKFSKIFNTWGGISPSDTPSFDLAVIRFLCKTQGNRRLAKKCVFFHIFFSNDYSSNDSTWSQIFKHFQYLRGAYPPSDTLLFRLSTWWSTDFYMQSTRQQADWLSEVSGVIFFFMIFYKNSTYQMTTFRVKFSKFFNTWGGHIPPQTPPSFDLVVNWFLCKLKATGRLVLILFFS